MGARQHGGATELIDTNYSWYPASGTTHTWDPQYPVVRCTNATSCTVTIPTGLPIGTVGVVMRATGAGNVTISYAGTKEPNTTIATTEEGQQIGFSITAADTATFTGHTPAGPKFLGYFADWAAVVSAYPVSGAEIAALNLGDYLICTGGTVEKGLMFTPNAAKTRMLAVGRRITLTLQSSIVGSAIDSVGTGVTSGQFEQATFTLPAYLAQTGDCIEIRAVARKVGTAAGSTMKVRIGTAGTAASDQGVGELGFSTTNNDDGTIHTDAWVISNTSIAADQRVTLNTRFNGSTVNNPNGGTVNFAAAQYVTCDMETINSSDSQQLLRFKVVLVQKP